MCRMRARSAHHVGWVSRPSFLKESFLSSLGWPPTGVWPTSSWRIPCECSWSVATWTDLTRLFCCLWGLHQTWTCGLGHVPPEFVLALVEELRAPALGSPLALGTTATKPRATHCQGQGRASFSQGHRVLSLSAICNSAVPPVLYVLFHFILNHFTNEKIKA